MQPRERCVDGDGAVRAAEDRVAAEALGLEGAERGEDGKEGGEAFEEEGAPAGAEACVMDGEGEVAERCESRQGEERLGGVTAAWGEVVGRADVVDGEVEDGGLRVEALEEGGGEAAGGGEVEVVQVGEGQTGLSCQGERGA